MMNWCTWNVRGLNNPCKLVEVKKFISQNNLAMVALLESRVKQANCVKVRKKFGSSLKWEDNYDYSERGRIWLAWDPSKVVVSVTQKSSQLIHGLIIDKSSGLLMYFTAVYDLHTVEIRKPLWQDLLQLNGVIIAPWCVMGNFNAISVVEDRLNRAAVNSNETYDFTQLLSTADLGECKSTGHFYSWSNKSLGETRTCSRIDRCLINSHWLIHYPTVVVEFMNSGVSDHSPLVMQLGSKCNSKGRPFKFFNYMTEHEEFVHIVKNT